MLNKDLKSLFWSYKFSSLNPDRDKQRIVINTINYGNWNQWQWLFKQYGKKEVISVIEKTPATEFRKGALRLASILFSIKKLNYASRGPKR